MSLENIFQHIWLDSSAKTCPLTCLKRITFNVGVKLTNKHVGVKLTNKHVGVKLTNKHDIHTISSGQRLGKQMYLVMFVDLALNSEQKCSKNITY